jgi:DNA-binding protein HU-beta
MALIFAKNYVLIGLPKGVIEKTNKGVAMNLTELVEIVSAKTGLSKEKSKNTIKAVLETVSTEVKKGGRVTIIGFGAFFTTNRRARLGRNPQTGEDIRIPATRIPRFRPGKEFKQAVRKARK